MKLSLRVVVARRLTSSFQPTAAISRNVLRSTRLTSGSRSHLCPILPGHWSRTYAMAHSAIILDETPKCAGFLKVSPYPKLLTHSRFLLTLRSAEGTYHTLILFRLSSPNTEQDGESPDETVDKTNKYLQLYAMESTCPHLGADSESFLLTNQYHSFRDFVQCRMQR